MTKYNTSTSYGENPDNITTLEPTDDTATQIMGSDWRMPTKDEIQELVDNTDNEWVTNYNGTGISGRKFTGSNGNSIFFPASGHAYGTGVYDRGSYGYFWSSSLHPSDSSNGLYLSFDSGGVRPQESYGRRCAGFCVRSVCM